MGRDEVITEARARIIWGEAPASVRYFMTSNGISPAEADAELQRFIHERNIEIRNIGARNVVIGAGVIVGSGVLLYLVFSHPGAITPNVSRAKGLGGVGVAGLYGVWKLIKGIFYLVRPQSEHESITEIPD